MVILGNGIIMVIVVWEERRMKFYCRWVYRSIFYVWFDVVGLMYSDRVK